MRAMHSPLTASLRLSILIVWTVVFMLHYTLLLGLKSPRLNRWLARIYWKTNARLLGFRINVRGTPSTLRPTLFVSNHVSYFDIIVWAASCWRPLSPNWRFAAGLASV